MSSFNARPPWGDLPDDILREIFIFTVTGTNGYLGRLVLKSRQSSIRRLPQLSISHVCSTWRRVSLLTPRLWNRVYIIDITHSNILRAAEWLSRSCDVQVSIKVNAFSWDDLSENEVDLRHSLLINLLSLHRTQHLEIQSDFPISLSELPAQSVANLEMLAIENIGIPPGSIELSNKRYPNLAHLSLGGNYWLLGACDSLLKLDASKSPLTVGEVWSFLGGCPLLEECHVAITTVDSRKLPIATNLYLPSLRILQFASNPFHHSEIPFASIIEPFTLPRLETFEVVDSSISWSTPAFDALAKRSNGLSHLKTFVLKESKLVIEGAPLLALIPSVTKVALCSSCVSIAEATFDDNALDFLASGILGPRIKELIVGFISNSEHFMNMVESRMENAQKYNDGTPPSFTKVQFRIREHYENISNRLNNMRQRGIPINVITGSIVHHALDT